MEQNASLFLPGTTNAEPRDDPLSSSSRVAKRAVDDGSQAKIGVAAAGATCLSALSKLASLLLALGCYTTQPT